MCYPSSLPIENILVIIFIEHHCCRSTDIHSPVLYQPFSSRYIFFSTTTILVPHNTMSSANYTHDEVRYFIQHANTSIGGLHMAKRLNTGLFSVNTAFFVYLNLQGMSISPSPKHFHTSTGIPSLMSPPSISLIN